MGTAHGAEELGLCSHGLAGAWGRYIGFCLGYGHIGQNSKVVRPAKISFEAHNFTWSFFFFLPLVLVFYIRYCSYLLNLVGVTVGPFKKISCIFILAQSAGTYATT
jgi:hypothetical protein